MSTDPKDCSPLAAATIAAAPFLVWIALMVVPLPAGLATPALAYAIRAAATAAVAVACWERRVDRAVIGVPASATVPFSFGVFLRHALLGAAAGLLVFALWAAPEEWTWYRRWLVWPPGSLPEEPLLPPYAPDVCGWPFTVLKLLGSAFVIAPVEEIFYRSFLYRWLQARDFRTVEVTHFDRSAFALTVLLFACEHDRFVVGALAGLVYGWLAVRRGLGTAIAAHVTTNLALGLYVIFCGKWGFW